MITLNDRQASSLPEFDDSIIAGMMKYIDRDTVMLEYGSGGSTLFFSKFVKELYTLEHYDKFYQIIKSSTDRLDNVHYYLVEPNHVKGKYVPADRAGEDRAGADRVAVADSDISDEKYDELKEKYPYHTEHNIRRYWQYRDYVDHVDELGVDKFDVVLVDGRARGFCATKVMDYIDESGVVFIDDFYPRLNEYFGPTDKEDFFKVFEEVERLGRMAVLKKRIIQ